MKKDWEIKKLGEVGTFIRGGNFSKKDFVEDGFPCIHYGQIHMKFGIETLKHISSVPSEMVKSDRCAKKGDLIIAITSEDDAGSCKCTAWMGDYDAYVGGHTAIYRHTMQPKYVSYYFNSPQFQKAKLEYTHGFKVVEINPKDIAKISIPVPPLEEQKRIVKILDEKFAQLETIKANAQTNLQNAKDLFQSQLTKAFSNTTWEKKRLGEVCDVRDGTHDSPKFYDKGYPLVTSKNLKNGKIEMINLKYISKEDYEKINERSKVDINDILFAMIGTIGNPVLVTEEPTYAIKNMALIKDIGNIFPNYLLFYLSSNCALDKMLHDSNGTTQRFVSLGYLRNFEIPLPPLPEQKRIVEELDTLSEKVRQLQEIYTKQISDCDELKQSLLAKAFEGEL